MIRKIIIAISGLITVLALLFMLIATFGVAPKLQTIWVTTAMTTMNHQWLATAFVPEETINRIMEENRVDDSGYKSEIIEFVTPAEDDATSETSEEDTMDSYEREGYEKLESGVYLKEVKGSTWRGNVMLVQDPKRIRMIDTDSQFEKGTTIKKMTGKSGAIAGINAGGFNDGPNYDSNGGVPVGLLIKDGLIINPQTITDEIFSMIGINEDGVLILKKTTAIWAMNSRIKQAVTFAPFLIVNGEKTIKSGTGGWGIAPRTAMGQRPTGEMLFLVIDGRQPTWSIGVDLKVLQDTLYDEGCINAAMLDGGSSTVMVYKGEFVNRPSLGKERFVNNCWGVF